MTAGDIQMLIGIVAAGVAIIGGIIVRDRYVAKSIRDGDAELHSRINKVKDDYVRRDDLDKHLERIEHKLDELGKVVLKLAAGKGPT
jgi:hypothetical protein